MKKFVEGIIAQRRIILFICAVIMVIGATAYYFIPKEENPDTTIPIAMITTVYPGASPAQVEEDVTIIIEEQIEDMEHLDIIRSHTMESYSVIIAEFDNNCDWQNTKNELNTRVSHAKNNLPESCQASSVKVDVTDTTDFIISLSGDSFSDNELLTYANDIKASLEKIDGVAKIDIVGYNDRQVSVVLDAQKLDKYNVSSEQVIDLLSAQNVNIPSGSITHEGDTINVKANTEFSSIEDIENIIVHSDSVNMIVVKLNDIAEVKVVKAISSSYEQDSQPAILVCGYFDKQQNAVLIGEK